MWKWPFFTTLENYRLSEHGKDPGQEEQGQLCPQPWDPTPLGRVLFALSADI